MLLVPADFFQSNTPFPPDEQNPPPRPPKVPLNDHQNGHGMRVRPTSVATFMTASTKVGEIPEHRWINKPAAHAEKERPLPYVIPPPLRPDLMEPKKKGRGFKFWRREERVDDVAAY